MSGASITVAVCTFRRYVLLEKLLVEMRRQSLPEDRCEILVVDNTDDAAARELFADRFTDKPGIRVVHSHPPGLSRARNKAIEECRTEYIAFIDDDALPSPQWLDALLEGFASSGASVVAGPIEPMWPVPRPDWVPEKYIGCLTVLDYGSDDRPLSQFEFAYGTNMAFRTEALREVGGFDVGLGRIGSKTLVSDEEIQTQLALQKRGHSRHYAARARVRHLVHENRISRNYFRSRMAWQAVSTLLHDSPLWWLEQSREEVKRAASELGVQDMVQKLLVHRDASTLSRQIDLIYHLFLVILNANNESDEAFELPFAPARSATPVESAEPAPVPPQPASPTGLPYRYAPATAISLDTRHLFVDAPSSHQFLFDLYAGVPGAQLFSFGGNLWDRCDADMEKLHRSLCAQLRTLTFMTLEPLVFGASRDAFRALLNCTDLPVFGILHRLPWTEEQAGMLRDVARRVRIVVLAESMAERLAREYGVHDAYHLPLHPTHAAHLALDPLPIRESAGVKPGQRVFSVLGEARNGKGIELLLASLAHVPAALRDRIFMLFGGRAKDFRAADVKARLDRAGIAGLVDLRTSVDPLQFAVLTERELGAYINITDIGVLLYQDDQRKCMSGVLPNYTWGGKPVVVTGDSIIGRLVARHGNGLVVSDETPESVARALVAALEACDGGEALAAAAVGYRASIAPAAVLDRLSLLLEGGGMA